MRSSAAIAIAAAASLVMAGCGSTDSGISTAVKRSAAPDDTTQSCAAKGRSGYSIGVPVEIRNNLDISVQVWFSDIDCADWWGPTPARYSALILKPGTRLEMVVGVWSNGEAEWTTTLQRPGTDRPLASFRQNLPAGTQTVGIWGGSDYRPGNAVALRGTGVAATARMGPRNTLVLAFSG